MSAIRVSLSTLCLFALTGCGEPITGAWSGTADLGGLGPDHTLGVDVTRDAKLQVAGTVVDTAEPGLSRVVSGTRVGSVVALAWQRRDGDAVETLRFVGDTDGSHIDGVLTCTRSVAGGTPSYCPSLPLANLSLSRGALVVDAAEDPVVTEPEGGDDTGTPTE